MRLRPHTFIWNATFVLCLALTPASVRAGVDGNPSEIGALVKEILQRFFEIEEICYPREIDETGSTHRPDVIASRIWKHQLERLQKYKNALRGKAGYPIPNEFYNPFLRSFGILRTITQHLDSIFMKDSPCPELFREFLNQNAPHWRSISSYKSIRNRKFPESLNFSWTPPTSEEWVKIGIVALTMASLAVGPEGPIITWAAIRCLSLYFPNRELTKPESEACSFPVQKRNPEKAFQIWFNAETESWLAVPKT